MNHIQSITSKTKILLNLEIVVHTSLFSATHKVMHPTQPICYGGLTNCNLFRSGEYYSVSVRSCPVEPLQAPQLTKERLQLVWLWMKEITDLPDVVQRSKVDCKALGVFWGCENIQTRRLSRCDSYHLIPIILSQFGSEEVAWLDLLLWQHPNILYGRVLKTTNVLPAI